MLEDFKQLLIVEITILLNSSAQAAKESTVVCVLKTDTEPEISPMYFGETFGAVTSEKVVVD
jgi:hypothetical protein